MHEFAVPVIYERQEDPVWCGAASLQMILSSALLQHLNGSVSFSDLAKFIPSQDELKDILLELHQDPTFIRPTGVRRNSDPEGLALALSQQEKLLKDTLGNQSCSPSYKWSVKHWKKDSETGIPQQLAKIMTQSSRPIAILANDGRHWVLWSGFVSNYNPILMDQKEEFSLEGMIILDAAQSGYAQDDDYYNQWGLIPLKRSWDMFFTPSENGKFANCCVAVIPEL
jgi:hypothetical protein